MKTIRITWLITLAVTAISLTWADDNEATKKDMAHLQGEWSLQSGIADGFPIPDTMVPNSKRVCKGAEVTATVGGQLVMRAKITIDPSKKPKTIDYDVIEGPTKGKKHFGIYELDGDTFKSCFGAPGAERLTEFTSKPGDKRTSTVWKRAKPTSQPEQKRQANSNPTIDELFKKFQAENRVALAPAMTGPYFQDALLNAASEGDDSKVRELLEAGHEVEVQSAEGSTPLMLACYGDRKIAAIRSRDRASSIPSWLI